MDITDVPNAGSWNLSKIWKKPVMLLNTVLCCSFFFSLNVLIVGLEFKPCPTMPRFTTTTPISWRTRVGPGKRSTTTERPSGKQHTIGRHCASQALVHSLALPVCAGGQWTSPWRCKDPGLSIFWLSVQVCCECANSALLLILGVFLQKFPLLPTTQWSDARSNTHMQANKSWVFQWILPTLGFPSSERIYMKTSEYRNEIPW